jgi:Ser/Thr protein kinase RdoA (MazF antagonist)
MWASLDYQIERLALRLEWLRHVRASLPEPPVPIVSSDDGSRLEMYV